MKDPITVIITDDKAPWREALKRELPEHNIKVLAEAENGLELLKLLRDNSPDIILLDLSMPVMDGSETMSLLNITYPEHKVIIMSQFDDPSLIALILLQIHQILWEMLERSTFYQIILVIHIREQSIIRYKKLLFQGRIHLLIFPAQYFLALQTFIMAL